MVILRPKPYPGESWPGYLLRLAEVNCLGGIPALSRLLNVLPSQLVISSPQVAIDQLFRSNPPSLFDTPVAQAAKRIFMGTNGRSLQSRLCPKCLAEDEVPFVRARWERVFELSCLVHGIFLEDHCPVCAAPVTILRQAIDRCKCGTRFSGISGREFNLDSRAFFAALNLTEIYASPPATFAMPMRAELDALVLCKRMLWLGSDSTASMRVNALKGDAMFTRFSMQSILRWFSNWPVNFEEFVFTQINRRKKPACVLLLPRPLYQAPSLLGIRKALDAVDRRRRTGRRSGIKTPAVTRASSGSYVGIRYLIDTTGCSYDVAKYWIDRGWLGEVTTSDRPGGQTLYRIEKQAADKAISIVKSTAAFKEMALAIGVDQRALRYLVKAKVFHSVRYGPAPWNVRLIAREVLVFSQSVLNAAISSRASPVDRILLGQAICRLGKNSPELLKPFVRDVLAGRLQVGHFHTRAIEMNQVTVRLPEFLAWRQKERSRHAPA